MQSLQDLDNCSSGGLSYSPLAYFAPSAPCSVISALAAESLLNAMRHADTNREHDRGPDIGRSFVEWPQSRVTYRPNVPVISRVRIGHRLVGWRRPTADILKATPKADNQWTDSA
jgi:hypothetical protein